MKLTKKELLERFAQSGAAMDEVWQWKTRVKQYTNDGPHSDFICYLGDIASILTDGHDYNVDIYTMDETEYNGSIMAPYSSQSDFEDEYGDKDAKVFVVVIDFNEDRINTRR